MLRASADQLLGVGVDAGRVDEPGGEAEGARVHAPRRAARSIALLLVGVGRPRLEAHRGDAAGRRGRRSARRSPRARAPRSASRYWAKVSQLRSGGLPPMPPAQSRTMSARPGASGRRGEAAHARPPRWSRPGGSWTPPTGRRVDEVRVRVHVDEAGRDHAGPRASITRRPRRRAPGRWRRCGRPPPPRRRRRAGAAAAVEPRVPPRIRSDQAMPLRRPPRS